MKADFPFFKEHPTVIYLDSAATTQKPASVIDVVASFYTTKNANAGRSVYDLSTNLLFEVEEVRKKTATFINAQSKDEIFFCSGATGAQQKVARSFDHFFKDGDEILYSPLDHASFVTPWVQLQERLARFGVNISLIPYQLKETGEANINDIKSKITKKTKLINITHIHNVFGVEASVEDLHGCGVRINVDAAQSIGHMTVDVQEIGADIITFSGHKMFAPLGTGVLYMKDSLQKELAVHDSLEEGTQNYAGIIGLGEAISYLDGIGMENVYQHLATLTQYAIQELRTVKGLRFTKGLGLIQCIHGYGIVSFTIDGVDPVDTALMLSNKDIMVRAGDHCVMNPSDETNAVRASMHIYNTKEDIDALVAALKDEYSS